MGNEEDRKRSSPGAQGVWDCKEVYATGIRSYGVIRIDSAASPAEWAEGSRGQHEENRADVP